MLFPRGVDDRIAQDFIQSDISHPLARDFFQYSAGES